MFIRAATIWTGSARQTLRHSISCHPLLAEVIRTRPLFFHSSSTPIAAMDKVDTSARLTKLRALMQERKVDVYSKYPSSGSKFPC
jgi:hypothetical protein